jgi:phthalate 4,5-dioxygenase
MEPIVDRSREHLGTSDVAVITMRRILLESVKACHDGGTPVGLTGGFGTEHIMGAEQLLPIDEPCQQFHDRKAVMAEQRRHHDHHRRRLTRAAAG